MARGFFACAPVRPSLAVDIELLRFCRQVFLRMTPSVTGWSEALEAHLYPRGVEFAAQVSRYSRKLRHHSRSNTGGYPQEIFQLPQVVRRAGQQSPTYSPRED